MTTASLSAEWEKVHILWRSPKPVFDYGITVFPSQPSTCYRHSHCTNIRPETLKKKNNKKLQSSFPLSNSEDLKCNDRQWFKLHCEPLWCVLAKLTREITRGAQTIQDWKTPTVFLFPVMINIISYWFKWEGL